MKRSRTRFCLAVLLAVTALPLMQVAAANVPDPSIPPIKKLGMFGPCPMSVVDGAWIGVSMPATLGAPKRAKTTPYYSLFIFQSTGGFYRADNLTYIPDRETIRRYAVAQTDEVFRVEDGGKIVVTRRNGDIENYSCMKAKMDMEKGLFATGLAKGDLMLIVPTREDGENKNSHLQLRRP